MVIASAVVVLPHWKEEEVSQKIANLPILATWPSGTSAMLSGEFNGPVAHGSTR